MNRRPNQISHPPSTEPKRVGRKRDSSRDADLLDAALIVLAEFGYEKMTMDAVAAHAKAGKGAIYRRWSSKAELVVDAVARMKRSMVDETNMRNTGSLRGDLLDLFKPQSTEESEIRMKIMSGLASLMSQDSTLVEAANAAVVEPWSNAHYLLMERAINRGEVSPTADIKTMSRIIPSMAAYRSLIQRKPFAKDFLVSLIDSVVLPALGVLKTSSLSTKKVKHAKRRK
jgi:AcrR family transcriptional regulator